MAISVTPLSTSQVGDTGLRRHSFARATAFRRVRASALVLLVVSPFAFSQSSFSVPGIEGLSFTETDTSYTIAIVDTFSINGIKVRADSLRLRYDPASGRFEMYGRANAVIEDSTVSVELGTSTAPGVVVESRSLSSAGFTITGPLTIRSLKLHPDSLGFTWIADSTFAMHGSLSVVISSDTLKVSVGTLADPGILVTGGRLSKLELSVNAEFSIKSLTIIPDSLGFTWLADSSFAMHGSLAVMVSSDTITVSAGTLADPGILVMGGRLSKLELSVNAEFSIKSLTIIPDSLGFTWLADSSFTMHGSLSVMVSADTVKVSAGTLANPGILVMGGRLTKLELSVSAEFSIKSLTVIPDSLGFAWLADSSFAMHGSLAVMISSDTVKVSAGSLADPGILVSGGRLSKLALLASGSFSIKTLTFVPDSLGFVWLADSSFAMHGSLSAIVANDTITVSAGTAADPGIVVTGGRLSRLQLSVNGRFFLKGLAFVPDSVGFVWMADSLFAMHGSLSFIVAGDTVDVSAGSVADPGLVIAGGRVEKLQLTVSGQFSYKGIIVTPLGIGFSWVEDSTNMFAMYGAVTVTVDGSVHHASFGDVAKPGFVIVNGAVTRWAVSLSDTLKLSGVSVALTEASLAYDAAKSVFSLWGGATVAVGSDTVTLFLGTEALPGLRIVDGKVVTLTAGVTTAFTVGGLKLSPDHLTFSWDDSTRTVRLYGSLSATFDGHTTTFAAGTMNFPGITIVNGAVKSLSLGVSADLHLASLVFKPRGLTFAWADSGFFELYGGATIAMASDTVSVILGDSTDPGMLIDGGTLEHLRVGVTADLHLNSLRLRPTALTFRYDKPTGQFSLYGGIVVQLAGDSIAAALGDSASPGLVYANGAVRRVHIGVSADFRMKGLSFKTDSLTLVWSSDSNYYKLYGGAGISIGPDSIGCDFGTAQAPGLIVVNGQLKYLSINVNSDIKIGDLEIQAKNLDLTYEDSRYLLKGSCSIKQVFSVAVTLGAGTTPGVILDVSTPTPQFEVQSLLLEISHANLGAVDLKDFKLQITNGQLAYSTVSVAFPGGWEVGAGIAFKGSPARIDSIGIDWAATSMQSAIVLPNGMLLAEMKGALKNIATPSELSFAGEVLLLYGGPVSITEPGTGIGREGALIYLRTFATISRLGMTLGADAKIGAYKVDTQWQSVLGEGTATLSVLWGQSAKLQGDFRLPSAPNQMVEIQPLVYFDSHRNFDALMDVTFYVPGFVPIIGGQRLGNADGALRYHNGDLWRSYAAAWVSGHALFWDWTAGAEYNFGSRSVSTIGDGNVSDIRRDIADDTRTRVAPGGGLVKAAGRPVRSIVHSFTTTSPPPSVLIVAIRWPAPVDSTVVTVLGPEGFYELTRLEELNGDSLETFLRSQKLEQDFAVVTGDSIATFIVAPRASFTYDSTLMAQLPPGQYQVVCTSYDVALDSVGMVVLPAYRRPTSEIRLTPGPVVSVRYSSMQTESTTVDLYVSSTSAYAGRLVKHGVRTAAGQDGYAVIDTAFQYSMLDPWIGESDSVWFYGVIEDGLNPPFPTEIVGPYYLPPALRGTITVSEGIDTVTAGLLVFVDEDGDGCWDTHYNGRAEIHGVTGVTGAFRIPAMPEGAHSVRVVAPPGYALFSDGLPVDALSINFTGSPLELALQLRPVIN